MKKILLSLFLIVGINFSCLATQNAMDIYLLAQSKNTTELKKVENIDAINPNGDTALCVAIKYNNMDAYNILKKSGANLKHQCVKNIPTNQYDSFIAKVNKSQHKKFLGISKWGWGAIGAGVLTGGAAVAMGGGSGGGGGSSTSGGNAEQNPGQDMSWYDDWVHQNYPYPEDSCPEGYLPSECYKLSTGEYFCKCDNIAGCNGSVDGHFAIECKNGFHETGNTCKSGPNILKECAADKCPSDYTMFCASGYHKTDDTCQSGDYTYTICAINTCDGFDYDNSDTCPAGYVFGSSCLSGEHMKYKCDKKATCPYYTTHCGTGYHETGNTCKSGDVVYKECANDSCSGYNYSSTDSCPEGWIKGSSCKSGDTTMYKCDTPATCPYNTTSCTYEYHETGNTCKSGDVVYKECVRNEKGKPIYGLYDGKTLSGKTIVNTDYVDIFGIYNQSDASGASGVNGNGSIDITNKNHGNVVGVFNDSNVSVVNHDGDYSGDIRIDNEGNGIIIGIENGLNANAYTSSTQNYTPDTKAEGSIYIFNNGSGNVYGIKNAFGNASAYASTQNSINKGSAQASGFIHIYNAGDGDVYGLFGEGQQYNISNTSAVSYDRPVKAQGEIYMHSTGNGNIYGMYSQGSRLYNLYASSQDDKYSKITANAIIQITANSNKNIYGMYGNASVVNSKSKYGNGSIIINNTGTGNAFGMYSTSIDPQDSILNNANDKIVLNNFHKNSTVYGIYGQTTIDNYGQIILKSESFVDNDINYIIPTNHGGKGIGIHSAEDATNYGNISITDLDDAYGIYTSAQGSVSNYNTIQITNATNAYGIYADKVDALKGTIFNYGKIEITNATNAYGIYAKSVLPDINYPDTTIINSGTIIITNSENSYGIYAEGNSTIRNTGTISINGSSCDGTTCSGSESYGNYIVLNGASLVNSGKMSASAFDFDSMNGNVVATNGAQFIAENDISGTLNLSSEIVTDGFDTTYVAENMIQAGDTSKLNLRSGSAMFDAKLADNGNDVVMTMKSFDALTDNKSLATYLADNYAKGTSAEFFGGLKSGANMTEFNNILNGLSGMNAFTQFDREDMSAMREINFSMNQQMFMNNDRDEYQVSGSMEHFSFSNSSNGGSGSYGISNSRMSDNWKLGYGLAMANIGTNDDLGTSRSNQIGLFYMPMTYTNDNIEFISTPRVGFAKSHYSRRGYNMLHYDGYIEKQIFGFNNDLRYPMTFGNWTIAPDLGFNAIMYRQSGHESDQAFSLIIPADEIYSVEAGFGLFTKYERKLDNGSLRFNSGVMLYRELADTYNMKLGIRGLDGTFNLYDDAEHNYSGAATFGIDYKSGRFSLYSNAQYFVDSDHYINLKGGISYRF